MFLTCNFSDDKGLILGKVRKKLHFLVFLYSNDCRLGADQELPFQEDLIVTENALEEPQAPCSALTHPPVDD